MTEKTAWRRSAIVTLFLLVVIVSLVGIGVARWYNFNLEPVAKEDLARVEFVIKPTDDLGEIANRLETEGLIRSASAFKWYVQLRSYDHRLEAGNFRLSASMHVSELVSALINQPPEGITVTILPGQRLDQVIDSLVRQGFSRQVAETATEAKHYQEHPLARYWTDQTTLEGYIYPETFVVKDLSLESAHDLIERSLDELDRRLTPDLINAFAQQDLTVNQAIILASIVGREVPGDEDRRGVAQVFLLRNRLGMRLGSDATYFYAGNVYDLPISPDMDHPYNTRLYAGLPPGPISNVDQTSLEAVGSPWETDYLYFLSGDDGQTYFNRTLQEHNQDRSNYCIEACRLPG